MVRRALGSASYHTTYEPAKGTFLYGQKNLHFVTSHTRHGVRFVTGIVLSILPCHTRDRGTICYGHWVLHRVISYTRQGVRFVTGIGFCILRYQARDRRYDV